MKDLTTNPIKILFTSLSILFCSVSLLAQDTYTIKGKDVKINGTSSIHDWESSVEKVSGTAKLEMAEGTLKSISSLKAEFDVKSIKSGKSIMDSKTWKALKSDKHPRITYTLSNIQSISPQGKDYQIKSRGTINIAGKSKTVDMTVKVSPDNSGGLAITGSKDLKMTDFGIDPPTAMLGTLKTGDEITVSFTIKLSSVSNSK